MIDGRIQVKSKSTVKGKAKSTEKFYQKQSKSKMGIVNHDDNNNDIKSSVKSESKPPKKISGRSQLKAKSNDRGTSPRKKLTKTKHSNASKDSDNTKKDIGEFSCLT